LIIDIRPFSIDLFLIEVAAATLGLKAFVRGFGGFFSGIFEEGCLSESNIVYKYSRENLGLGWRLDVAPAAAEGVSFSLKDSEALSCVETTLKYQKNKIKQNMWQTNGAVSFRIDVDNFSFGLLDERLVLLRSLFRLSRHLFFEDCGLTEFSAETFMADFFLEDAIPFPSGGGVAGGGFV
jgi:hypothetical protein